MQNLNFRINVESGKIVRSFVIPKWVSLRHMGLVLAASIFVE